ncbi:MAG: hypothetical protein EBU96_06825 [Actinobacteria bacterium]|nr:hypothetical protein [Actinomycetota bacterium]
MSLIIKIALGIVLGGIILALVIASMVGAEQESEGSGCAVAIVWVIFLALIYFASTFLFGA